MADNLMKCPICNQETTGRFCESCGFELHVLPEGVSDEVIQYENERVERHKKAFDRLQKLQEFEKKAKDLEEQLTESQNAVNEGRGEISKQQVEWEKQKTELEQRIAEIDQQKTEFERLHQESESKVKELEKQLTESKNAVNASQSEISKQQTEFEQQKKRLEQQETELQNAQKTNADLRTKNEQLDSDLKKSQAEVSLLSTQLGASQNENLQLRKDLDEAKRKAAENKGERPKAFILLRGSGDEAVGAVYSGLNTYGCVFGNINEPNHQELNITGLKLKHFGIETVGDRFRLVDYVGDITSASGTRAGAKGLTLSNGSRINIGEDPQKANCIKGTFIITS